MFKVQEHLLLQQQAFQRRLQVHQQSLVWNLPMVSLQ
jgi:hypothetical protein